MLDEPLANLDPLARHEVMRGLMAAVAETGMTVVLSSHVVSDLENTCDWLVVLNRGRVQVSGDIEDLLAGHRLLTGPAELADGVAARCPWWTTAAPTGRRRLLARTGAGRSRSTRGGRAGV